MPRVGAVVVAVLLTAAAAGCASAIPQPTAAQAQWAAARWSDTTVDSLAEGRSLYVAKCGGCHSLYLPRQVVGPEFPANLNEMGDRAQLNAAQKQLIERYLVSVTRAGDEELARTDPDGAPSVALR